MCAVEVLAAPCSLQKLWRKLCLLPFPAPGGCKLPSACGHITPISASVVTWPHCLKTPLPLSCKDVYPYHPRQILLLKILKLSTCFAIDVRQSHPFALSESTHGFQGLRHARTFCLGGGGTIQPITRRFTSGFIFWKIFIK